MKKIYRPHYSTTTDARVLQTRQALHTAFLGLLDEKPLDQITIREITSKAGIGYTTFFRHHPSKEELLAEIANTEIATLIQLALQAFGSNDIKAAATTMCQYIWDHRSLWSTLLTGGAANYLREEFIRICREIASDWEQDKQWLPADAGIILVSSGTIELLAWWLREEQPIPVSQLAEIYEKTLIKPVAG
ncbi:TetR/AcrR family transcriptional regulator [Spongiibacter sp. KMU-158]|uniref:TetR/AcrR family transcriptional regulator n=1 Tax=Spongiibacter pelagi TaxID=2760804 RepID=A0A927C4D3_9GAMM|nr:TetR/AcrR family transcriptional regulator [Spongiibacter pelagi]MBD2859536.1 TetR/AcrR family transcriptional regulator [Spongiibacter pelagi]